jgi:hypothetical protein
MELQAAQRVPLRIPKQCGEPAAPIVAASARDVASALAHLRQRRRLARSYTGATTWRRMRVDTTVVETNIDYPTDSTLLGNRVRVLTRTMK